MNKSEININSKHEIYNKVKKNPIIALINNNKDKYRIKQIIMFLIGYTIGSITTIKDHHQQINPLYYSSYHNNQQFTHHFMNQILSLFQQHSLNMNKQQIIQIFIIILQSLKYKNQNQIITLVQLKEIFIQAINLYNDMANYSINEQQLQLKLIVHLFQYKNIQKQDKNTQKNTVNSNKPQSNNKHQITQFHDFPFPFPFSFHCQICQYQQQNQVQKRKNFYMIQQCRHSFHISCLNEYLRYQITKSQYCFKVQTLQQNINIGIKCPYDQCNDILKLNNIHEIVQLDCINNREQNKLLIEKYYDKILQSSIINNNVKIFKQLSSILISINQINQITLFYCPTTACNAIYELQTNCQPNKTKLKKDFNCLKCHQSYCLDCFNLLHPTMTCSQYKIDQKYLIEDELFGMYLLDKGKKYKRCPSCRFWVDNWRGCITIKCRCGTQFCYKCGQIGCPHGQCLNIK